MLFLSNRFKALAETLVELPDDDFIGSVWDDTKKAYNETCSEVLGNMKREDESWISEDSYNLIDQRNDVKRQQCNTETNELREEYRILSKRIKKSIRRDRRNQIEELANQDERAAERFDSKEIYNITKIIKKPPLHHLSETLMVFFCQQQKNSRIDGLSISVMYRPPPIVEADIAPADNKLNINIDPPTETEIRKCIGSLKNVKAAGPDDKSPEKH